MFNVRRFRWVLWAVFAVVLAGCAGTGEKDETAGWSEQKLYKEAMDELNSGGYDRAIKYFEKLEARFPFGVSAQQAQLNIAYAYYRQSERAQALSAIDRFMKLHPAHPATDYALYLRGLINFNGDLGIFGSAIGEDPFERDQQSMRESFETFKELVSRFPTSKYAGDARLRMAYIINALAKYDVAVARYYYRRGGYLAAANRAQKAISEYPQAPAVEEALVMLIRSYDKLGLTTLRDDAKRVYALNYPKSDMLAKGLPEERNEAWWKLW
ncbi:MAG: outer membrane protein assembly factor BamD [Betaproteobacteria bacterium]|nr:outer membrane protein assembly factor BamD [Betaproteobacteria bacterium]MDE2048005.1 outer membrane protein assembly factor BamD [Betaproteobacteria bacterium]